jgi:hypothetical protein
MITHHMLARPREREAAPRLAGEITLRSRELARRDGRIRPPVAARETPAPRQPARAAWARAWARALLA